jgi:hypothetical protein
MPRDFRSHADATTARMGMSAGFRGADFAGKPQRSQLMHSIYRGLLGGAVLRHGLRRIRLLLSAALKKRQSSGERRAFWQ